MRFRRAVTGSIAQLSQVHDRRSHGDRRADHERQRSTLPITVRHISPGRRCEMRSGFVEPGSVRTTARKIQQLLVPQPRGDADRSSSPRPGPRRGGAWDDWACARGRSRTAWPRLPGGRPPASTSPSSSCAGLMGGSVSCSPGGPDGGSIDSSILAACSSAFTAASRSPRASRAMPPASRAMISICLVSPRRAPSSRLRGRAARRRRAPPRRRF